MTRELCRAAALAVLLATGAAACAPRTPPATAATAPRFPEFVFPAPGPDSPLDLAERQREAWGWLQAGDLRAAERVWSGILSQAPDAPEALAGLGYLALARRDPAGALHRFDQALAADAGLPAAHAGRGQALVLMDRPADAIDAFQAAQQADPALDYTARIEALRLRGMQQAVSEARTAAAGSDWESARTAYLRALEASPDSAFLLRELAAVERRAGRADEALRHIERAIELDPADRSAYVVLGQLREQSGDVEGAVRAYEAARALEAGDDVERRLADLRERLESASLPEAYRAIASRPAVTRADVAALAGVHLPDLLSATSDAAAPVVTDVREHWASAWILDAMRAGLLEPFPNHTFQPDLPMSRGDIAQVVARALDLMAAQQPGLPSHWRSARPSFSDVAPEHPLYPAAAVAVSAGILTAADGAFEPSRPVTGAEALEAFDRLRRIAGPRGRGAQG